MLNEKPTIIEIFGSAKIKSAKRAIVMVPLAIKSINVLTPFPITIPVSDKMVLLNSALLRDKYQLYD